MTKFVDIHAVVFTVCFDIPHLLVKGIVNKFEVYVRR